MYRTLISYIVSVPNVLKFVVEIAATVAQGTGIIG
jgi:hypothetical protein